MKAKHMKYGFVVVLICMFQCVHGQRGDELLVYAVKGKVTMIQNNQESPVKVGRVLKYGTSIRTEKDARVTLVCKQGKPLSVSREGVYPVSRWRDSCRNTPGSVTSNYFQYIWSELYKRSDDYKDDLDKNNNLAVVRGEEPYRNGDYPEGMTIVEFPPGMDTVNYTGEDLPLSWISYDYNGKYQFRIYTSRDRKLVFRDSVEANEIFISRFSHKLKKGTSYAWTISANANTGVIRRRILNYVSPQKRDEFIRSVSDAVDVHEDSAARYFRIAYLLEKKHYLAEAYAYYKKAAEAAPEMTLYFDKVSALRYEYRMDILEAAAKKDETVK
jgi:hypothetical protein